MFKDCLDLGLNYMLHLVSYYSSITWDNYEWCCVCFKIVWGSASDVYITRNSGQIDMLNQGDDVMVDTGFIHLR